MKVKRTKYSNGSIKYFKPNTTTLHRLNGPAIIHPDGSFGWYKDGLPHRDGKPAFKLLTFGSTVWSEKWWWNGLRHRDNGPAEVFDVVAPPVFWFYGNMANNEEQFYNTMWRNRILAYQI